MMLRIYENYMKKGLNSKKSNTRMFYAKARSEVVCTRKGGKIACCEHPLYFILLWPGLFIMESPENQNNK